MIQGTAAEARVELWKDSVLTFTDYLSLYKFPDGWSCGQTMAVKESMAPPPKIAAEAISPAAYFPASSTSQPSHRAGGASGSRAAQRRPR